MRQVGQMRLQLMPAVGGSAVIGAAGTQKSASYQGLKRGLFVLPISGLPDPRTYLKPSSFSEQVQLGIWAWAWRNGRDDKHSCLK
jgi:hypothetical protein